MVLETLRFQNLIDPLPPVMTRQRSSLKRRKHVCLTTVKHLSKWTLRRQYNYFNENESRRKRPNYKNPRTKRQPTFRFRMKFVSNKISFCQTTDCSNQTHYNIHLRFDLIYNTHAPV